MQQLDETSIQSKRAGAGKDFLSNGALVSGHPVTAVSSKPRGPLSLRVIILGLLFVIAGAWFRVVGEVVYLSMRDRWAPLFVTPIVTLFALAIVNRLILRYRPQSAFSRGELLALYVMVAAVSYLGHLFSAGTAVSSTVAYPYWKVDQLLSRAATAGQTSDWTTYVLRYLPTWVFVTDTSALRNFFTGASTLYTRDHLLPWLAPLTIWFLFQLVIIWTMLCLSSLLVKPWVDAERLTFPGIRVPMAVMEEGFFQSKPMWIGLFMALSISSLGVAHRFIPQVPAFSLGLVDLSTNFNDPPLNVLRSNFFLYLDPWAIALAYFVPLDLAFSAWFFHLMYDTELIVARILGDTVQTHRLYMGEQATGAWMAFSLLALWAARKPLIEAVRQAFSRRQHETAGPLSPRVAVLGAATGIAALLIFSSMVGIRLDVAIGFWVIFILLAIGITRLRAELGGAHTLGMTNPVMILTRLVGARTIGGPNLGRLWIFWWDTHDNSHSPMPNQLEALKMARESRVSLRSIAIAMMLACVVLLPALYWVWLHMGYKLGVATRFAEWWEIAGHAEWGMQNLQGALNQSPTARSQGSYALVTVFAFCMGLRWLRNVWLGCPFHPAGMAMGLDFTMIYLWSAFFLAWLLKLIVLRYGGIRLNRQVSSLMVGFVLGDFSAKVLIGLTGIGLKQSIVPWA